jgi:hypothetical protein
MIKCTDEDQRVIKIGNSSNSFQVNLSSIHWKKWDIYGNSDDNKGGKDWGGKTNEDGTFDIPVKLDNDDGGPFDPEDKTVDTTYSIAYESSTSDNDVDDDTIDESETRDVYDSSADA